MVYYDVLNLWISFMSFFINLMHYLGYYVESNRFQLKLTGGNIYDTSQTCPWNQLLNQYPIRKTEITLVIYMSNI